MSIIRFDISWLAPAGAAKGSDRALLELLAGIRVRGSIAGAAKAAGVSYRHAWGMLNRWEGILGAKVVSLERGRGAALAPLGERLLEAELRIRQRIEPVLARLAAELDRELAVPRSEVQPELRMVASHDLALLQLRDFAREKGLRIDLQVRGSSESLAAYSRGDCDVAGFHLIAGHPDLDLRQWLDPRRDALIRFTARRQGLIVKRGNPKRIRTISDLARPALWFVNRQAGSGTRALFDRLLADAGMRTNEIRGYAAEEYTHLAVAATVASGMADAGFGIEAAAARHGLDFVPVATEDYLLACRARQVKANPLMRLRKMMADAAFRKACAAFAGYDLSQAGKLLPFSAITQFAPAPPRPRA
ncbi:MAG: helix-turn-helix transcriptional regulator [Betaproteobacteria bacterium]|nr:helix-turn-helix transcriptional regulator [Betaproteobacteria bacterium]MBI2959176.1 helix-turn-helix transcriptional regulator [Betaproteobacteria bacterium]